MKSKQDILNRIYKACFIYPNIKEEFFEDWGYIANALVENREEVIPLEVLSCVDFWLNTEFDLKF